MPMYSRRRRAFVGWALLALAQSGCADPSGSQPAQEPTSTAVEARHPDRYAAWHTGASTG